jgi:hypothetical protein
MAAEEMRRFGLSPRAALLSHSNFGTQQRVGAEDARRAGAGQAEGAPDLEVDGEMHGDTALDSKLRKDHAGSTLKGDANLLVMPNIDAGQHRLQPAQDGGRQRHRDRPGAAGLRQAGAHPDAVGDGAPHRQHDGAVRGGREHANNKKALVTGITGQDGAYLAQLLLEKGYRSDRYLPPSSSVNFWRIEELGIQNTRT